MKKEILTLKGTYINLTNPIKGEYYLNIKHKKGAIDNYNILSILFDKTSLNGNYGVNQLLEGLKNVKISFDDDISNIP